MLEEVVGDLFEQDVPAWGHGCNCVGAMGAGVALGMSQRYPKMYRQYRRLCKANQFQLGGFFRYDHPAGRTIYNLATQPTIGPTAQLWAIDVAVRAMLADAHYSRLSPVAIPRIGAGFGGLPWPLVHHTLRLAAESNPVRLIIVTEGQSAPPVQPFGRSGRAA